MTTLFVPGENDADNKKKSGSMSDDGTLFGSCSVSLCFYVQFILSFSHVSPFSVVLIIFIRTGLTCFVMQKLTYIAYRIMFEFPCIMS